MFVPEARVSDAQRLRAGDIVVAMSSGSASVVGKAASVEASDATRSAGFGAFCGLWRPADDMSPWLRQYFQSPEYRQIVSSAAAGININNLRADHIGAIQIRVPPAGAQRRIVAKLESLQSRSRRAREVLDAVPPLLEKLRQSILAAAFRGDLTKDWRAKHKDVEPASELLKRLRVERRRKWEENELARMKAKGKVPGNDRWKGKYEEPEGVDATGLPELPEGWCWASVDEVSVLQLGQQRAPIHAAAEKAYPYVRAANITWDGLDLSDMKEMGFPDRDRYLLEDGDVLLSEASGSPTEVGKPAIWRSEIPGCCYQKTLLRVRPVSRDASSEWLHLGFLADALLGRFAKMAPGVGILHLTADRMLRWPVALAPSAEQEMIIAVVQAGVRRLRRLEGMTETATAALSTAERAVLAKAFRGELVPQDPSDERTDGMLEGVRENPGPGDLSAKKRRGERLSDVAEADS
ncbi:MAG TPA: hypothetical protein VGG39_06125 [Polyangiaceae bacterium]